MKHLKLFLAGLFLSLIATSSFASPNPDSEHLIMRVNSGDAKSINITLANLQQVTTNLALKSIDGKVYYVDTIRKHNGYGKNLSLHKVPKGRYLLTVSQKGTEMTSVLVVGKDEIKVSRVISN